MRKPIQLCEKYNQTYKIGLIPLTKYIGVSTNMQACNRYMHQHSTPKSYEVFNQFSNNFINISPCLSARKVLIVRGQNLKRDKITLARSSSPYAKKITIRYESPKKVNLSNKLPQNFLNISDKKINNQQEINIKRPKILDKKKKDKQIIQKQKNNFKISFKSVKSVKQASTNLFIQTPQKNITQERKIARYGSTDQTQSAKSLSRVSIDEKVFDE